MLVSVSFWRVPRIFGALSDFLMQDITSSPVLPMLSPGIICLSKELWFFLMETGIWNLGSRQQGCSLLLDATAPGPLSGQSSRGLFHMHIHIHTCRACGQSSRSLFHMHMHIHTCCACALSHSVRPDSVTPGIAAAVSPIRGTDQASALEWVAISSSRGSSQPRDWTRLFHLFECAGMWLITHLPSPAPTHPGGCPLPAVWVRSLALDQAPQHGRHHMSLPRLMTAGLNCEGQTGKKGRGRKVKSFPPLLLKNVSPLFTSRISEIIYIDSFTCHYLLYPHFK